MNRCWSPAAGAPQPRPAYPVSVSCPADLPMDVGPTLDCVVTRADKRFAVKLEVTRANPPANDQWTSEVGGFLGPAS